MRTGDLVRRSHGMRKVFANVSETAGLDQTRPGVRPAVAVEGVRQELSLG